MDSLRANILAAQVQDIARSHHTPAPAGEVRRHVWKETETVRGRMDRQASQVAERQGHKEVIKLSLLPARLQDQVVRRHAKDELVDAA
jgi:hypothetical protein